MDTQRFKPLTPETMTPEQKEIADKIKAEPAAASRLVQTWIRDPKAAK